jgi:hypothetical protein
MTYPQLSTLDEAGFRAYFLSHDAFVARLSHPHITPGLIDLQCGTPGSTETLIHMRCWVHSTSSPTSQVSLLHHHSTQSST